MVDKARQTPIEHFSIPAKPEVPKRDTALKLVRGSISIENIRLVSGFLFDDQ
jgi:hypothetical protein